MGSFICSPDTNQRTMKCALLDMYQPSSHLTCCGNASTPWRLQRIESAGSDIIRLRLQIQKCAKPHVFGASTQSSATLSPDHGAVHHVQARAQTQLAAGPSPHRSHLPDRVQTAAGPQTSSKELQQRSAGIPATAVGVTTNQACARSLSDWYSLRPDKRVPD
jgi:hypothetical protein